MTTGTIEIVQFRLVDGKTDADLQATHSGISSFLQDQQGFIYRSISRKEDGTYVDIVYWEGLEQAKKASDAIMQDPRGQAMIALCDMESVSMEHLAIDSETMSTNCMPSESEAVA